MNNGKSKSGRKSLNSMGMSSLLVIFVVLATVILSVLCLVTVRQDLDRAKKLSTAQEEYYAADVKATERLDKLYELVSDETIIDISAAATEQGFEVSGEGRGDQVLTFSWSEDINSQSKLVCKVRYSDGTLSVTGWKTVNNNYYEEENSLPIWNGESLPV